MFKPRSMFEPRVPVIYLFAKSARQLMSHLNGGTVLCSESMPSNWSAQVVTFDEIYAYPIGSGRYGLAALARVHTDGPGDYSIALKPYNLMISISEETANGIISAFNKDALGQDCWTQQDILTKAGLPAGTWPEWEGTDKLIRPNHIIRSPSLNTTGSRCG